LTKLNVLQNGIEDSTEGKCLEEPKSRVKHSPFIIQPNWKTKIKEFKKGLS